MDDEFIMGWMAFLLWGHAPIRRIYYGVGRFYYGMDGVFIMGSCPHTTNLLWFYIYMVVYCFYVQPFYDNLAKEYRHIVSINCEPMGPLKNYVRKTIFPRLSTFVSTGIGCSNLCVYAIKNMDGVGGCCDSDLLGVDNVDALVMFLIENNYTINKDITKIMNNDKINVNNGKKLLFYVNYSG